MAVYIIVSMMHGHTNIKPGTVYFLSLKGQNREVERDLYLMTWPNVRKICLQFLLTFSGKEQELLYPYFF